MLALLVLLKLIVILVVTFSRSSRKEITISLLIKEVKSSNYNRKIGWLAQIMKNMYVMCELVNAGVKLMNLRK